MGTSAEKAEALPHRSTVIATDAAKSGSSNGMGRGRRCDKDEAVLPEKDIMAFGFGFVGNSLWGLSFFFLSTGGSVEERKDGKDNTTTTSTYCSNMHSTS